MVIRARECRACGHEFDLICRDSLPSYRAVEGTRSYDHECCPKCESTDLRKLIGGASPVFTSDTAGQGSTFPYYSENLGMWIKSHAHRKQVMRENDLVEWEPVDVENAMRKRRRLREERIARMNKYKDELMNHPDNRSYKYAVDRGEVVDRMGITDRKHREATQRALERAVHGEK